MEKYEKFIIPPRKGDSIECGKGGCYEHGSDFSIKVDHLYFRKNHILNIICKSKEADSIEAHKDVITALKNDGWRVSYCCNGFESILDSWNVI